MKRILIVAAHPDDEILGCGGTAARLVSEGCQIHTLILGEGITARDDRRRRDERSDDIARLRRQVHAAGDIIGVKEISIHDFPDNRFDSVPLLDIIKTVEKAKQKTDPHVIFTHHANDLNIDHRITHEAVLAAARPQPGEKVREIYAFEVPSATEWRFPDRFSPDLFYDITGSLDRKIEALEQYAGELRQPPHPRSLEGIRVTARYWGQRVGVSAAEAFRTIRVIR